MKTNLELVAGKVEHPQLDTLTQPGAQRREIVARQVEVAEMAKAMEACETADRVSVQVDMREVRCVCEIRRYSCQALPDTSVHEGAQRILLLVGARHAVVAGCHDGR